MTERASLQQQLEANGFATVRGAIGDVPRGRLLELLKPERLPSALEHRSGLVYAGRHLLAHLPELADELQHCGLDALASEVLGRVAFPVDAAYFDKQSTANWSVPAHQDRVLPVAPDSGVTHRTKRGVAVAEPSPSTLARMLALRLHFDPTDENSGALCVAPTSHASGVLRPPQVQEIPLSAFVPCSAHPGDVLLMRPLLLHRSSPSKGAGRRRVLHVFYATEQPDEGLRWRGFILGGARAQ